MTQDKNLDELLSFINLLAGIAQAGGNGILAQAALNVMRASEAVVMSRKMLLDEKIQQAAEQALQQAQQTFLDASKVPEAMQEARDEINSFGQQTYQPRYKAG